MNDLWRLFFALGDPHRLEMVHRLASQGPLSMSRLTSGLPFSRQGGAKHVGVLTDVGLISVERRGREKIVSLQKQNLHLTQMFLKQMEGGWDERLSRLERQFNAEE